MSSGIIEEFVKFIPFQSPHPTVQPKPYFLHVHTLVLQFVLQLYLIIFSTAWGAIGECGVSVALDDLQCAADSTLQCSNSIYQSTL